LVDTKFRPLTERWDGSRWTALTTPQPSGSTNASLSKVSCPSASTCIATGYSLDIGAPFALQWDGTNWTQTGGGLSGTAPSDLSCGSATSCIAVGANDGRILIHSWSGSDWSVQSSPNPSEQAPTLGGVSCTSATFCATVGRGTPASGTEWFTLGLGYG